MGSVSAHSEHPYRWVTLIVLSLAMFVCNAVAFQLAGMTGRLFTAFHLLPARFVICLTAPLLLACILGIPFGALTDRFGAKAVGIVALIIAFIGTLGRTYYTSDFGTLFLWMVVLGFGLAFINANGAKILGNWFTHAHMGMAMGVFIGFASIGIATGDGTASFFPSIRSAFMASWVAMLVVLILWILAFKTRPERAPNVPPQPVFEYLGVAAKSKYVWLAGIVCLLWFAGWVASTGNIPNALTHVKGVSPVIAGLVGSALALSGIVGSILGPMILNKIGLVKPYLAALIAVGAICLYLSWSVPFGALTWILMIIAGITVNPTLPLIMSMPVLLPELGPTYAGSAGGVMSAFQMGGGFFVPSFVIATLAGENATQTFIYISIAFMLSAMFVLTLPEHGFHHK
jgi:nitrate/nitrite transporter NarK